MPDRARAPCGGADNAVARDGSGMCPPRPSAAAPVGRHGEVRPPGPGRGRTDTRGTGRARAPCPTVPPLPAAAPTTPLREPGPAYAPHAPARPRPSAVTARSGHQVREGEGPTPGPFGTGAAPPLSAPPPPRGGARRPSGQRPAISARSARAPRARPLGAAPLRRVPGPVSGEERPKGAMSRSSALTGLLALPRSAPAPGRTPGAGRPPSGRPARLHRSRPQRRAGAPAGCARRIEES